jgi:hypothetical protein
LLILDLIRVAGCNEADVTLKAFSLDPPVDNDLLKKAIYVGIGVDFVEEEKHVLGRISLSID